MSSAKTQPKEEILGLEPISSMKRGQLEEELMSHGIMFAKNQLVPELRTMLTETRAAKGIARPRANATRCLIAPLSGLNKAQLLARAKLSTPEVDPTWTAGKLQTVIRTAEFAALTPHPVDRLSFGKYQGQSYYQTRKDDPSYCDWCLEQEATNTNPEFNHFIRYLKGPEGSDPTWIHIGGSTASSSRTGPPKAQVKEEQDLELARLKQELNEMKQELRAQSQVKRGAKEETAAMPVEPAASSETLTEIVSFCRSMATRLDSLEAKK